VADAAGHDEDVPDGVVIGDFFINIKYEAEGVGQSAQEEPNDAAQGNMGEQGLEGDENQPAKQNIDRQG